MPFPDPCSSLKGKFRTIFPLLAAGLVLLTIGCAMPKPNTDPAQDAKAKALVLAARAMNEGITTSKGLGQLTYYQPQGKERFRLAWAAQAPNKLRLTLLASAHPVETIAASGEWVTMVSHTGKHKPHSATTTDPDLTPYIQVPVKLSDMVSILLGRLPLRPFDRAWFVPGRPDLVVRTSRSFTSETQELAFDPEGKIRSLALLDRNGNDVFRIEYRTFRTQDNWTIPEAMTLSGAHVLDLTLSGFQPNEAVKEEVFRLTSSGS